MHLGVQRLSDEFIAIEQIGGGAGMTQRSGTDDAKTPRRGFERHRIGSEMSRFFVFGAAWDA